MSLAISLEASARSLAAEGNGNQCIDKFAKEKSGQNAGFVAGPKCGQQPGNVGAEELPLPTGALNKLIVHAGFGWGIFSGTVYNGNKDYSVTQITVRLTPMTTNNSSVQTSVNEREYDIDLALKPLAKGSLSMPVPSDNTIEYSWKIEKARGYKVR